MEVHDTACVPVLEEGRAGADPYAPAAAGAEPGRGRSCPGIRSLKRCGRGRERVRALLEIQLRPDDPGAPAPTTSLYASRLCPAPTV